MNDHTMKISEPRAIVFYGDINGFTSWSRRVRRSQVAELLRDTYAIYDHWSKHTGFWVKKQADGFIGAKELSIDAKRPEVLQALRDAYNVASETNEYLHRLPFPRPPLFRIRGTLGDVLKLVEASGRVDYAGDPMNLGDRMLDLLKEEMFLVGEAVVDEMGHRGCHHLKLERRDVGAVKLVGVDEVDQKNFFAVMFNSRKCKGDKYERCELCPISKCNKRR